MSLTSLADITVEDDFTVHRHLDAVALHHDFFGVPSTQLREDDTFGRNDAIHRTMYLIFAQILVDRCIMVENLDFHTLVSCIHTHRSTDADTIVHTFLHEAEFETEDEITVFLLCIKIAVTTIMGTDIDDSIHRHIVNLVTCPLVQVFTVEQHFETFLGFLVRQDELR